MPAKRKIQLVFLLLFGLFVFLSLNRHSHAKPFTYHAELWADKAGYNVYLPSAFIYHFDASQFLPSADSLTGDGFYFDTSHQTIITKYPYGVSLLQSPFWLLAHAFASEKTGYSTPYLKAIDIAACFYFTLGLYFMFLFFRRRLSGVMTAGLTALMVLSTGVFYYGIFEGGMSHVYSFCLAAAAIYVADTWLQRAKPGHLTALCLLFALYVMVRPIDLLFLAIVLLFTFIRFQREQKQLVWRWLRSRHGLITMLLCVLLILPQLLYYRYAFGSLLTQPYKNEGFTSFSVQHLLELLFSANNGLFIYYPALLLLLLVFTSHRHELRMPVFIAVLAYIVIYSSWWSTSLGCGFGHRAINDLVPLIFVPLRSLPAKKLKWCVIVLTLFSLVNLKFIFSFDGCLFRSNPWDYSEYTGILLNEIK